MNRRPDRQGARRRCKWMAARAPHIPAMYGYCISSQCLSFGPSARSPVPFRPRWKCNRLVKLSGCVSPSVCLTLMQVVRCTCNIAHKHNKAFSCSRSRRSGAGISGAVNQQMQTIREQKIMKYDCHPLPNELFPGDGIRKCSREGFPLR